MKTTTFILALVTLLFIAQLNSHSQWSSDPNNPLAVCNEPLSQLAPTITQDGSGGYFVFWVDRRNYGSTTTADLYGQRLDASGNKLWASAGIKIFDSIPYYITPKAIYTGNGNDIILYSTTTGGNKIWARKINSSGNNVWTNPVALFIQTTAHVAGDSYSGVTDGSGGVIVSYELTYNGGATFVFSQRIDANGNLKWNLSNNGLNLSVNGQSRGPVMTTDGRGGANIFWYNVPGPYYIWKTHIDSSGNFLPKDTLKLTANNYPQIRAVYDGSGGAVVTWANYPGNASSDIYAQRVDITGNELWNINGVVVCNLHGGQFDHDVERTSDGNYIIVWADRRRIGVNSDVYSQKINSTGTPQWTVNGVLVTNLQSVYPEPKLISDNSGGAYIFLLNSQTDFSAARINSDSTLAWNPSLRTLASDSYKPFYEHFVLAAHSNGAVVVWRTFDAVGPNGIGIFGAKINSNGTINIKQLSTEIPNNFCLYQNYPNPFNPVTNLEFGISDLGFVVLKVYDITGKEVATLVNEKLSAGSYEVEFDGSSFSSGVFFYKLITENFSEVKRMILLK